MKELVFKTNINCGSCLNAVTPYLNEEKGIVKWQVDVTVPEKLLTVQTVELSAKEVIEVVEKAGYEAELQQSVES